MSARIRRALSLRGAPSVAGDICGKHGAAGKAAIVNAASG